jgi:hypothetical protein
VTLRLTISQSVCLGVEPTLGLVTRYYFPLQGCCLKVAVLFLWGALRDERTGLQSALHSLNGPSCTEPLTPPTWRARLLYCIPQEQGGPVILGSRATNRSQSQIHFTADSQSVLVSSPLCGRLTRYCFLFKGLGLKFVVLSVGDPNFEVTLRLMFSQSVCLGIEHPCGTCDQILLPVGMLLSEICGHVSRR